MVVLFVHSQLAFEGSYIRKVSMLRRPWDVARMTSGSTPICWPCLVQYLTIAGVLSMIVPTIVCQPGCIPTPWPEVPSKSKSKPLAETTWGGAENVGSPTEPIL